MNKEKQEEFVDLFDKFSEEIQHNSAAHGFWDAGHTRNKAEMIALMHSELSEALEAIRSGFDTTMDEHCPEYRSVEIELADCMIRIMDFAYGFDLDVGRAMFAKHKFNINRPPKHGKAF